MVAALFPALGSAPLLAVAGCDSGNKAAAVAKDKQAPDVTLTLHDGTKQRLSELKGHHVLLYFYPKDDTPG